MKLINENISKPQQLHALTTIFNDNLAFQNKLTDLKNFNSAFKCLYIDGKLNYK